jgi:DnaK suppressor protein
MGGDLERIRAKLIAARQDLGAQDRAAVNDIAPVSLDQESVGRLSRVDAMQMQAMAVAQARRRRAERAAIDAALARLDSGEYGYCLGCGEPIAPARLEHSPAVTNCMACASAR